MYWASRRADVFFSVASEDIKDHFKAIKDLFPNDKAFEEYLNEPQEFSNGAIVISREKYSQKEASKIVNEHLRDGELMHLDIGDSAPSFFKEDTVVFRFHDMGEDVCQSPCWILGRGGKGAKKVWSWN